MSDLALPRGSHGAIAPVSCTPRVSRSSGGSERNPRSSSDGLETPARGREEGREEMQLETELRKKMSHLA